MPYSHRETVEALEWREEVMAGVESLEALPIAIANRREIATEDEETKAAMPQGLQPEMPMMADDDPLKGTVYK